MCGKLLLNDHQAEPEDTFSPEAMFLTCSPAQVLYHLEVLHALLIPALDPLSDGTLRLQLAWLHSGNF